MKTKIISILITFLMLSSIASAVEIRGTVSENGNLLSWNAQNFAGFYYDIDKGLSSENLSITLNGNSIPENGLIYNTVKIPVEFSYSKNKGKPVIDGKTTYDLVGWKAEKWVALNGKANKLVKLITEMKDNEKITLTGGSTMTLGNGYILKVNSVDANANPRQAWVQVMKDGKVIDDAILQQDSIYNLQRNVGGEDNSLVLSAYVSSIFSGAESQMVQLQYVWLIDESSLTEIKTGSKFGSLEVTTADSDKIELKNSASMSLSKNSVVDIMGNMKFKVADSDTLRFYPKVDVTEESVKETNPTPIVTQTQTPLPTPQCTPEIRTVEKIVTVTVTPEPTPIPTQTQAPVSKSTPGFEIIFAIAGLISVAFLVLKQRK